MKKLLNYISEAFYPADIKCIVCDCELNEPSRYGVCAKCKLPTNDNYCTECGRPIPSQNAVCDQCKQNSPVFDGARSSFRYEENAARLVKKLKYYDARYLASYMAQFMADTFYSTDWEADVITFVPLHKRRRRIRGYNQSELLAKELGGILKLPFEGLLVKTAYTKNMAKLNRERRQQLIKGTFALADCAAVKGKSILLIDDVLTTGATACECAQILSAGGARQIFVLTFASVQSKPPLTKQSKSKRTKSKPLKAPK